MTEWRKRVGEIEKLLDQEFYSPAAKECVALIEGALRELLKSEVSRLDSKGRLKVSQAELEIGKGSKGIDEFTMGQLLGVIRMSKLFESWERATGEDLGLVEMINLDGVVKLRNKLIHDGVEAQRSDAELLLNVLRVFLDTFTLLDSKNREKEEEPAAAVPSRARPDQHSGEKKGSSPLYWLVGLGLLIFVSLAMAAAFGFFEAPSTAEAPEVAAAVVEASDVASGNDGEASEVGATEPEPEAEAPSTAGSRPPSEVSAEAERAYRESVAAFNAGDAERYFASFADTLDCYYGDRDQRLSVIRTKRTPRFEGDGRLHIAELEVLRSDESGVLLLDRGAWWVLPAEGARRPRRSYMQASASPVAQGVHEKLVLMREVENGWRIVGEEGLAEAACLNAEVMELGEMPEALARCRRENASCLRQCDTACEGGGGDLCNSCPTSCGSSLATCVGAGAEWFPVGS